MVFVDLHKIIWYYIDILYLINKNMKFIKSFLVLFFTVLLLNNTFAEDINTSIIDLDSTNSNLIKIFLDKEIISTGNTISWDIKVFKDLNSTNIVKDLENNKIITINLANELEKNTSYSLLSVYWAEWTIDFKIWDIINGLEINGDWTTWVSKINIIDSKTIKVLFEKDILWNDIDIKILKEYSVSSLTINEENKKVLEWKLTNNLDENSKYLIMLFSFTISEWNNYIIDNSIYDFTTSWNLKEANIIKQKEIKDEQKTWNIALNSAETPDTGPETWILLLATFLLSNFVYFRKKLSK